MTISEDAPAPATLAMVTIDCAEVRPEAEFWAAFLGLELAHCEDDYAMLTGDGPRIGVGRVDGFRAPAWPDEGGTKQFHFDLAVADLGAARSAALELGAAEADPQPGETWLVMIDPAGHPFCLTKAENWP